MDCYIKCHAGTSAGDVCTPSAQSGRQMRPMEDSRTQHVSDPPGGNQVPRGEMSRRTAEMMIDSQYHARLSGSRNYRLGIWDGRCKRLLT